MNLILKRGKNGCQKFLIFRIDTNNRVNMSGSDSVPASRGAPSTDYSSHTEQQDVQSEEDWTDYTRQAGAKKGGRLMCGVFLSLFLFYCLFFAIKLVVSNFLKEGLVG